MIQTGMGISKMVISIFTCCRIPWAIKVKIAYRYGPECGWSPSKMRSALSSAGVKFLLILKAINDFCTKVG
jgi:hypothetical protein